MMEATMNRVGATAVHQYMDVMLDRDVVMPSALPEGGKIIAANHPTTTDPLYILPLVKEPMHILITEHAFKVPLVGRYLRAAGHIPVVENNRRAAFDKAVELLKQGKTVGIFPEGNLSPREGGLHRARTGTVRLALTANVPLVPVGIALEPERIHYVDTTINGVTDTARWYLRGPYAMTVGDALYLDGCIDDWSYVRKVSSMLLSQIGMLEYMSATRLKGQSKVVDSGIFPRPAGLSV
jgi:1-acyl-sn-glycerol-3-phosphate acyltransferase